MELSFNLGDLKKPTFKTINRIKLQDGDNEVHIAPPKTPAEPLFKKWTLHWGFADANGKTRPLACPKQRKTDYCPICEASDKLLQQLRSIEDKFSYERDGKNQVQWDKLKESSDAETHKQIKEQWDDIRPKTHWYYNAFDASDNLGLLQVPKSVHEGIIEKLTEVYRELAIDPVSLEDGVWLNIKRTGKGPFQTRYEVEVRSTIINHPELGRVKKADRREIPEAVRGTYKDDMYDIANMYKTLSAQDLVDIMNGEAEPWSKLDGNDESKVESTKAPKVQTVSGAFKNTPTPTPTVEEVDDLDELTNKLFD